MQLQYSSIRQLSHYVQKYNNTSNKSVCIGLKATAVGHVFYFIYTIRSIIYVLMLDSFLCVLISSLITLVFVFILSFLLSFHD